MENLIALAQRQVPNTPPPPPLPHAQSSLAHSRKTISKHSSYTSSVQGSELPAFNAAEIARDIRVNLKLREKQRLTGTSLSAVVTFALSSLPSALPFSLTLAFQSH
jgi:hypothetical protein